MPQHELLWQQHEQLVAVVGRRTGEVVKLMPDEVVKLMPDEAVKLMPDEAVKLMPDEVIRQTEETRGTEEISLQEETGGTEEISLQEETGGTEETVGRKEVTGAEEKSLAADLIQAGEMTGLLVSAESMLLSGSMPEFTIGRAAITRECPGRPSRSSGIGFERSPARRRTRTETGSL